MSDSESPAIGMYTLAVVTCALAPSRRLPAQRQEARRVRDIVGRKRQKKKKKNERGFLGEEASDAEKKREEIREEGRYRDPRTGRTSHFISPFDSSPR